MKTVEWTDSDPHLPGGRKHSYSRKNEHASEAEKSEHVARERQEVQLGGSRENLWRAVQVKAGMAGQYLRYVVSLCIIKSTGPSQRPKSHLVFATVQLCNHR